MNLWTIRFLLALTSICVAAIGFAQTPGRGGRGADRKSAPPPGSAASYKTADELKAALMAAVAASPSTATSPIGLTDEYYINVVRRGSAGAALTHAGWTELHYILDGGGIFVTGGSLAAGGRGEQGRIIEGGVERHVAKGDAILVPADTPHWYKEVDGFVTYLEVRFVAPKKDK